MKLPLALAALLAAPAALACPMADKAAYEAAAEKVKAAEGTQLVLAVEGMHCGSCSEKITAALGAVEGVTAAAADYQAGHARVAYDPAKVQPAQLVQAVEGVGFKAKPQS